MGFEWSTVGTVTVNGVRLGVRDGGDPAGAPVLLLHGTGSRGNTWHRFAGQLAALGRRPIAADLRGHADSARTASYALNSLRDDVLGLLETLDLRDAVLVGHSVGGHAALAASLLAPDRISRLVLEDLAAPPRASRRQAGPAASGTTAPAVGLGPARTTGLELVHADGPTRAPKKRVNPARLLVEAGGVAFRRRDYDLRAMISIFRQLARPDAAWWDRLGEARHPTLLLSGGPTSLIPPQRLAEVATAITGARLTTIPIGHRVHSLAPAEFAAAVLPFLAEPALSAAAQAGQAA